MICTHCAGREPQHLGRAGPPREATLLLRVWQETGGPRARLLAVEGGGEPVPVGTAQGVQAICAAVRTWLTSDER